MSARTKRRLPIRDWRTGVPFVIGCCLIGYLVGWLGPKAFSEPTPDHGVVITAR